MQKQAHVTVSAKKGGKKKHAGKITHMVIRGAKNGFISETHRKQPPMNPSEPYQPNEPEMNVHASPADVASHFQSNAPDFEAGGDNEAAEEQAENEPKA